MRKATSMMVVFLGFLLWGGPAPCEESLSRILEGIKERYSRLPGLSAEYTREVVTRSMSMLGGKASGDQAAGALFFKTPCFLRLDQKSPSSEMLLTDGKALWWYTPKKGEVHRYDASKLGKELSLLSDIFRGLVRVGERFEATLVSDDPREGSQIELRPTPPWEEIDRVVLTVSPSHEIRGVDIVNSLQTVTRFTISNLQGKGDFQEDFFQFTVPEGVKLIREGAM